MFAVPHEEYKNLEVDQWLNGSKPIIIDAFNVLSKQKREAFRKAGCKVVCIGRGDGL